MNLVHGIDDTASALSSLSRLDPRGLRFVTPENVALRMARAQVWPMLLGAQPCDVSAADKVRGRCSVAKPSTPLRTLGENLYQAVNAWLPYY